MSLKPVTSQRTLNSAFIGQIFDLLLLQYPSFSVHKNDGPGVCRPLQSHCSSYCSAASATRLTTSRLTSPPLPNKVRYSLFWSIRTKVLCVNISFIRSSYSWQHFPKTCWTVDKTLFMLVMTFCMISMFQAAQRLVVRAASWGISLWQENCQDGQAYNPPLHAHERPHQQPAHHPQQSGHDWGTG